MNTFLALFQAVMILTCREVCISLPETPTEGYVNIKRELIKPGAKKMLQILLDFNYRSLCLKQPADKLKDHVGGMIQKRIRQLSWCLQGVVNWNSDDPLIEYEAEPCFLTEKDRFLDTHFIRICPCTSDCQWRSVTLIIFGLCHDIVRRLRRDLRLPVTLESIFSRPNVFKFLSNYTEMTGPGQFRVKPEVPRVLNLNLKTDIDLNIRVFQDDIVTRDECIKPMKSQPPATLKSIKRDDSIIEVRETGNAVSSSNPAPNTASPSNPSQDVPTTSTTVSETPIVVESFADMLERILKAKFGNPE